MENSLYFPAIYHRAGGLAKPARLRKYPLSEVRDPLRIFANELRKAKGTSKPMMLVPLFGLKFLFEFAADGAGTSNRRH
jgi:hypothetical protein